jgi:type I restriction enzyme M protein
MSAAEKSFSPRCQRCLVSANRVEDIGLYLRGDLKPTEQLKTVLRDIRNHLAGNVTGITRDEELARQILNILFCKVFDEAAFF